MRLVAFEFEGEPVPAPRLTRGTLWTDRAQNYLGYKRALADALRAAHPQHVITLPATEFKKERSKAMKAYRDTRYELRYFVFSGKRPGDWDNFGKTVSDALKDAGLIPDDRHIKCGSWVVCDNDSRPRIEIELYKMERF